jgi:heptaprenyl diphosphate synthase
LEKLEIGIKMDRVGERGLEVLATDKDEFQLTNDESANIRIINTLLSETLADSQGIIGEMCKHLLNAGGKRIRPLLVLHSGMIFAEGLEPCLLQAAIAVELVHMASLVHDDVIDESNLRRNRPSVNKLWGNQAAVLGGDYLFAKAFSVLAENHLIRNLNLTVQVIQEMCYGEIIQAEARYNLQQNPDNYYRRIAKKTAVLLQCACKCGAIVAGATETQIEQIGAYGLNLGFAFQIVDDILDFCGDSTVMGKPKHEDLTQGNLTLPALLLIEHPQFGAWFKELIVHRQFQAEELGQIDKILAETGLIQTSFEIALSYIEKAKQILDRLPDNRNRDFLVGIADQLKTRTQ